MSGKLIRVAGRLLQRVKPDLLTDLWPDVLQMVEEKERKHLADLGRKYHVPVHEFRIRRQIFMDEGRDQVFDSGLVYCDSPVRNYYNLVFAYANFNGLTDNTFGLEKLSLKDTGGVVRYASGGGQLLLGGGANKDLDVRNNEQGGLITSAGYDNQGLIIGSDNTAWTFEDFVVNTLTPNGSGSGPPIEFDYSQSELHSVTNAVLTLKDTRIRDFNNNSGGAETIEEVCEYATVNWSSPSPTTDRTIMLIRDLTGGDAVADTAQYRVTLESTLVYPA